MLLVLYVTFDDFLLNIFALRKVQRLRLLGDYHHSTRIAFVEFTMVVTLFLSLFTETVATSVFMASY